MTLDLDDKAARSPTGVLRLTPAAPVQSRGYDLDSVEIEYAEDGELDFRLVLGRGIDIFWLLPVAACERLRLVHVDAAAYHVDEPSLRADPFSIDVPRQEWTGRLAEIQKGTWIVGVGLEARAHPGAYRLSVIVQAATGPCLTTTLAWESPS